jgi:hypothetical protein
MSENKHILSAIEFIEVCDNPPEQLNEFMEKNKYIKEGDDNYKKSLALLGYDEFSDLDKMKGLFGDVGVPYLEYKHEYAEGRIDIVIEPNTAHPCYFIFKNGKLIKTEIDQNN